MIENAVATIRLLIVSREAAVLRALWSVGESNSWHLETAGSGWEALERLQSGAVPDLLLLDLPRGDADALHVLRWLRRLRPELPIILLAHAEDIAREKEAIRLGAQGFLLRPFDEEQLGTAIRDHLHSPESVSSSDCMSEDVEKLGEDAFFVGASPIMQKLRAQAELLSQADVPVLIVGEPGTGRETTARLIHKLSLRSGSRFLKVNCAALPGDLLEKELFGYGGRLAIRGEGPSAGKLELCDKGTIFLDEIIEMPMALQEKLLLVLQEKQFLKPGTASYIDVDVRVLVSSDINIERAPAENKLREDLYYRLSAFTVHVPALRQRRDEIQILLQHFMHKLARHYGLPPREFSAAVLNRCQHYSWPGNVTELENFVKRYLMIGDDEQSIQIPGDLVLPKTLDRETPGSLVDRARIGYEESSTKSLRSLVRDVKSQTERNAIAAALEKTGWNRKAAARLLKVSYRTMLYKIDHYRMSSSDPFSLPFVNGNGVKATGSAAKDKAN
ncbi:MAG TPA: sigma-54 dependent transcriptional regulator [Terriglobales bacterium]|nr:sigma-54 dependent transcriptional regulator [Terriglobales bacterium]